MAKPSKQARRKQRLRNRAARNASVNELLERLAIQNALREAILENIAEADAVNVRSIADLEHAPPEFVERIEQRALELLNG